MTEVRPYHSAPCRLVQLYLNLSRIVGLYGGQNLVFDVGSLRPWYPLEFLSVLPIAAVLNVIETTWCCGLIFFSLFLWGKDLQRPTSKITCGLTYHCTKPLWDCRSCTTRHFHRLEFFISIMVHYLDLYQHCWNQTLNRLNHCTIPRADSSFAQPEKSMVWANEWWIRQAVTLTHGWVLEITSRSEPMLHTGEYLNVIWEFALD